MSRIGPDGPAPDLPALIRTLRPATARDAVPVPGAASRPVPPAPGAGGPDGPSPGARPALPALRALLQDSLAAAGGPAEVARRLVARLATPPGAPAGADPLPVATPPGAPAGADPVPGLPAAPARASAGVPLATAQPPVVDQLARLLPASPAAGAQVLGQALGWLAGNLDKPATATAECTRLGPALAALGVPPDRIEPMSLLLAETLLASLGPVPQQQRTAWQATARLAARWVAHGTVAAAHEPPYWAGTVVGHHRYRQDLAVLRVRTYLPYPYRSGQRTAVESAYLPDVRRPCWLATPPPADNVVELHVRAGQPDPAGAALVGRVETGDTVRLYPADGPLVPDTGADLLLVAEDTGIAPMRALVAQLRAGRDRRRVCLLWLASPNEEPYDLAAVTAWADDNTAVLPVATVSDLATELATRGPWAGYRAYVAGTPTGVAAALTALAYAGVPAADIRHDQIGTDD